jgi:hypothetical protein
VGVALGVSLSLPPCGQFARVPWPGVVELDGAVDPSVDGLVVVAGVGLADGSGLAADTTAAPPAMRSAAAIPAVRTVRRNALGRVTGSLGVSAGVGSASGPTVGCVSATCPSTGSTGWSFESIWISLVSRPGLGIMNPDARGRA